MGSCSTCKHRFRMGFESPCVSCLRGNKSEWEEDVNGNSL